MILNLIERKYLNRVRNDPDELPDGTYQNQISINKDVFNKLFDIFTEQEAYFKKVNEGIKKFANELNDL